MSKVLLGIVLTLAGIITAGYMVVGNNITIEKVTEDHNKTIIVDGKVQSSENWTDVLGFNVSIDLKDGTYIGK